MRSLCVEMSRMSEDVRTLQLERSHLIAALRDAEEREKVLVILIRCV